MTGDDRSPARGFTLIELLVVIGIAAILVALAAPALQQLLARRALAAQAAAFMSTLRFARAEALKRGDPVSVCAADPAAAEPRCLTDDHADWRAGWLVFVDHGLRGALEAGDPLLRVQQALAPTGGVASTRPCVTFTAAGFSVDAASHYRFAPPAGGALPAALLVCVSKQGRARLAPGAECS